MSFVVSSNLSAATNSKKMEEELQDMRKSERENDSYSNTDWEEQKAAKRLDEFCDLNQGEKNFFKLWNRHVRSLPGVGGTHMSAVVLR